ncbi:hypothetical protein PQ469_17855 [Mucilaginibacter sp. KACC 22773]|uniref:hypothetical protein n=1 Tax=Mucilaginibacter sp. KACC 22773 TaxID=3025671 RepID=UPI0023673A7A|nr:hypothetical protein [Mucilaginibacter sp. KACC 22773]WDF75753.1 hypothetical protein PQ469_17855 [Mucilaginibacter sp. KACC 22773]
MKKSFAILFMSVILASCAVKQYTIGMSETEFTASQKYNLSLVEATQGRSVYKRVVEADAQRVVANMYYYFKDGRLVRMERVEEPKPAVVVVEKAKS